MKKNIKGFLLLVIAIISIIVGIVVQKNNVSYAIFFYTIGGILCLVGIEFAFSSRDPIVIYEKKIKNILNTYDSILVRSSNVPDLEDKTIIYLESFDDLVDAQFEIRKPICYLKQTESCAFLLMDSKVIYLFIEKLREDVLSPIEIEIKEYQIKSKSAEEMDSEMLRNIEKTTIIKLSNKKSYKVSPIRKENKEEKKEEKTSDKVEELFDSHEDIEIL